MPLTNLGHAALAYAEKLKLYVLPLWGVKDGVCLCSRRRSCARTGKHPISRLALHGKNDASNDPDVVRQWWDQEPDANIGIACGLSDLLVVDIDPRNGGDVTWDALVEKHGQPSDTWEAETGGGGTHLVFGRPSGLEARDSGLPPGIDIKAGGYIVAAPSVHMSGREYTWLANADPNDHMPLAFPPDWLIEKIQMRRKASPSLAALGGLKSQPRADVPQAFMDALAADEILQGIWDRSGRPQNQKDASPSGWSMSLWRRLIPHRLAPQDVLDTLIAFRRKHHDTHKEPRWFVNEAAKYAAEIELTPSTLPIGRPPAALRRNASRVDRTRELVEEAVRHGEEMPPSKTYERLLLIHLAGFSKDGETAWPSQERLANATGVGPDHVSNKSTVLERWGCIEKLRHSGPKTTIKYGFTFLDTSHEHTN